MPLYRGGCGAGGAEKRRALRIGRKPNHIPSPRLSMMLAIQPEVSSGLMNNPTFRGRGLCGRFLYAVCKSKVGRRETSPASIRGKAHRAA